MEIRFAKAMDVPGIIELLRQVGLVHHKGRPDIFRDNAQKYAPSQVLAMLDKSETPIFVAVEECKVVGYCFCQMKTYYRDSVINDHTTCYIDDLCVDETCRGHHIGKTLYLNLYTGPRLWSCHDYFANSLKIASVLGKVL